jgi:hypothetical protein
MSVFDVLLEKELAIKAFDYPEESGQLERGGTATERILNFGTSRHPGTGNALTHGLDLNTLTAEDAAILLKPEYLEHAWKSGDPIERRDRLIAIINRNEASLDSKGDGAEEGKGGVGYNLMFKRGPAEHHDQRRIMTPQGEKLVDEPHESHTSSWKDYKQGKVRDREIIVLDLDPFRKVLGQLDAADEDYTFKNLTDDYLRNAGDTGEAIPINPDDIMYGEPAAHENPEFVDEQPIEPAEIDAAKAKEVPPEPAVDVKFEPETDIATGEVGSEFKPTPMVTAKERPDIDIEPTFTTKKEPKPKKIELAPDLEKAIDRRVKQEVEKEIEEIPEEPELETAIDQRIEPDMDEEPEKIEESINRALSEAGLL